MVILLARSLPSWREALFAHATRLPLREREATLQRLRSIGLQLGILEWTGSVRRLLLDATAPAAIAEPDSAADESKSAEHKAANSSAAASNEVAQSLSLGGQPASQSLADVFAPPPIAIAKAASSDSSTPAAESTATLVAPTASSSSELSVDDRKREDECRQFVERLRREHFGVGMELSPEGLQLVHTQNERMGRALKRLSADLYRCSAVCFLLSLRHSLASFAARTRTSCSSWCRTRTITRTRRE